MAEANAAPVQGPTVLIADDDQDLRDALAQFLASEGYRPLLAANGRDAIAALESAQPCPDIILLDLMMPGVNGYAVLEYLRHNRLDEIPVLVMSAHNRDPTLF